MLQIAPEFVYATTDILRSAESMARAERMIEALDAGSVAWVSQEELDEIAASGRWDGIKYWGEIETRQDPDIVFTTAKFLSEAGRERMRQTHPHSHVRDLFGFRTFWRRPDGDPEWRREKKGIVCQSAYQLHTVTGCPFRCSYCSLGGLIRVLVNIEEVCCRLGEWFELAPAQRLYKWDNASDVPCFEPEYDASRLFVARFAQEKDRYLEIYVGKSADTDYLLDYDHRGHTILQWSIGGPSQTALFEEGTDGMIERLEAARRCQEAGYIVRFRLSPIIPVKNWREENRLLLEEMFARTRPDVVSLCPFGWMDVEAAERCLDFDLLDEDFVSAMRAAAPFLQERGYTAGGGRPIPHDARYVMLDFLIEEIQRLSPKTIIALCLETEEMWQAMGPRIGASARSYVCNCGPYSAPGGALYDARTARSGGSAP